MSSTETIRCESPKNEEIASLKISTIDVPKSFELSPQMIENQTMTDSNSVFDNGSLKRLQKIKIKNSCSKSQGLKVK